MSAVYERLGARSDQVPLLWLAAPLTGLLVQPIVGALSDRTWGRLGRRRPYFLTGAILASIALFVIRSEEHTSELQSQSNLVCRLLLEKKKKNRQHSRLLVIRLV